MKKSEIILRSPQHDDSKIKVGSEVANLSIPFNGTIGSPKGDEYPVTRNIIELLGKNLPSTTLAQNSNFIGFTADAYEEYWRNSSIKLISGEDFSIEDEKHRLISWFKPVAGELYLDLGCSTGLYARTLATKSPDSSIIALDFALPMLRKAREKSASENLDIYLLQANAEDLPFFSSTFDGITIGGTLNEFKDPVKALYEARRVLNKNGRMFVMYLLKADSIFGSSLQMLTGVGGISFWNLKESEELFNRTGFKVIKQDKVGIVSFCLLEAG